MNVFLATLQAVGSMLGIGLIGFLVLSRKVLPPKVVGVLSPLVIDIAIPCMVFTDILTRFEPNDFPDWWSLPLWWVGFTVFSGAIVFAARRFFPANARREAGISLFYPNAIFTPIVIIAGIFGPGSPMLAELYLYTLLFPFFLFNSSSFIFGSGKDRGKLNWKGLLNPVLVATVLAMALKLSGAAPFIPEMITNITRSVGNIAYPLIMILIGGNLFIDLRKGEKIRFSETALFLLIKNLLFPVLTLGVLLLIRPPFPVAFLTFLMSAVPPVTTAPLIVRRLKGNVAITNQFLLASFLFSLITLPLAMWVFGLVFPFK